MLGIAASLFAVPSAWAQGATLITGARVFDGTGAAARVTDVLVDGDRIVAVGPDLAAPDRAERIDGSGKTLIPGLHDLHTHLRSPAYDAPEDLGKAYAGYLLSGVTTVDDFSVSGEMIAPIRALVTQPGGLWAPHLEEAVRFGVPGGHGTEYGWGNFFTLQVATERAAHLATPLALSYDPDLIKVFADGWRYGRDADLNSMNEATLAAIVADAHAAGKPVITHTVTLEGAKVAAAAGVNAVGHGVGDALIDDELIGLMREHGTAYVATLVVYEPQQTRAFAPGEWAQFTPDERAREVEARAGPAEPVAAYDAKRWAIMRENIRRLKKAGIAVGIGTDAGIGGVYHGPATVREIWWLTKLGFTPAEALVAATRTSAAIIGQDADHGTIQPGKRADLVLIDGKPDRDIADLWKVSRVWVGGREAPLAALRQLAEAAAPTPMPVRAMRGPIDSSTRADGRTDLDTLPVESTDPGVDHSELIAVSPGGEARHRFLVARMGAAPRPFAQWVLPFTRGTIDVADASRFTGIEIALRGAGTYRVELESYGLRKRDWFASEIEAGETMRTVRIPFAEFESRGEAQALDLKALRALAIELSAEPGGRAWLELGAVRFY
ncbi:hypothetical protein B2G71_01665 [Novosphingobium sp. PC22D]|nr:hypothetical protein B2G71_01665 [Novosphingobium sp. PC22D]